MVNPLKAAQNNRTGNYNIPEIGALKKYNINSGVPRDPLCFSFGFKYWRQIRYFGVSGSNADWFVSLLRRFGALENELLEEVRAGKRGFRLHAIDWDAKNIPIKKELFANNQWLGEDFFDDNDLFQVQVSTGKGRIIGFFDENDTFQIVLLDKHHNAQPSKDFNYKVTRTGDEFSEYDNLLAALCKKSAGCMQRKCCHHTQWEKIKSLELPQFDGKVSVFLGLERGVFTCLIEKCCDSSTTFEDIVELGLASE